MLQLNPYKVIQFVASKDLQAVIDDQVSQWWTVVNVTEHQRTDDDSPPDYYILFRKH